MPSLSLFKCVLNVRRLHVLLRKISYRATSLPIMYIQSSFPELLAMMQIYFADAGTCLEMLGSGAPHIWHTHTRARAHTHTGDQPTARMANICALRHHAYRSRQMFARAAESYDRPSPHHHRATRWWCIGPTRPLPARPHLRTAMHNAHACAEAGLSGTTPLWCRPGHTANEGHA